jgi:hypothetical protein
MKRVKHDGKKHGRKFSTPTEGCASGAETTTRIYWRLTTLKEEVTSIVERSAGAAYTTG